MHREHASRLCAATILSADSHFTACGHCKGHCQSGIGSPCPGSARHSWFHWCSMRQQAPDAIKGSSQLLIYDGAVTSGLMHGCCLLGHAGVEVAAELHDMVAEDLRKIYPDLVKDVHIRVSPAMFLYAVALRTGMEASSMKIQVDQHRIL